MPLFYPIAANAREALDTETGARTVAEARELANGPVALVSDWLRPLPSEFSELQPRVDAGVARGFVQLYEDAKGQPVIAIAYWKRGAVQPQPVPIAPAQEEAAQAEDDTDDLYFAKPGAKAKRKKKAADPNQMDLFGRPARQSEGLGPRVDVVEDEADTPTDEGKNS